MKAVLALFALLFACVCAQDCSWSYSGDNGPEFWGSLCNGEYAECSRGAEQSPIALVTDGMPADGRAYETAPFLDKLLFDYRKYPGGLTTVYNQGSQIYVEVPVYRRTGELFPISQVYGGRIGTNDKAVHQLVGYVLRAESEHTVDGVHHDLEVQYIHKRVYFGDPRGLEYVVVSVFFDIDRVREERGRNPQRESWALRQLVRMIDSGVINTPGSSAIFEHDHDFAKMLPETRKRGYWTYDGSWTTPGCDEVVEWYVMKNVQLMSRDQFNSIQGVVGANNRPVQPTGGRTVFSGPYSSSASTVAASASLLFFSALAIFAML